LLSGLIVCGEDSSLNDELRKYLEQFDIDIAGVGDLVGEGTQHRIFHYQKDNIIKVPKPLPVIQPGQTAQGDTIKRDLATLKPYLGEYLIDTKVLVATNGSYIILQAALHEAHQLSYSNFTQVRDDLNHIVTANRKLAEDKCLSLDLLGNSGYWGCIRALFPGQKRCAFSNNLFVVLRGSGQFTIKIVDVNLIPSYLQCARSRITPRSIVDAGYYQVQRFLLKHNFNVLPV
jgi:hypothetical protein